jgi:hypothetical protein
VRVPGRVATLLGHVRHTGVKLGPVRVLAIGSGDVKEENTQIMGLGKPMDWPTLNRGRETQRASGWVALKQIVAKRVNKCQEGLMAKVC